MKTKLEFGKRGREKTEIATERYPTTMERLMSFGSRWWPGQRLGKGGQGTPHGSRAAKLSKSRSLPQRRP